MDQAKFEAFIAAATRKTKSGELRWRRVGDGVFLHESWKIYDMYRSFMCTYAKGNMVLALDKNSGVPRCLISPDGFQPYQQATGSDADDSAALVLRLYNVVYNLFPSVDSFIDAMIGTTDDSGNPSDSEALPF